MGKETVIFTERRIKMQGYAVGYEILQDGIVVKKVAFPTPVKNMIVDTGKDLFCAGAGAYSTGYSPLNTATRYMARGSGSTPTTAGMTTMEAQIGNRSNSYLAGDPNTGVRYDLSTGVIYLRKTYDAESEVSNQNINEVGFFTSATLGVMFSRIVLPSTVTVLTGQQLRLTYELQVTIGPIAPTSAAPVITGWTTDGDSQLEGLFPATSAAFGSSANQFIGVWGTTGADVYANLVNGGGSTPDFGYGNLLLEPSVYASAGTAVFAGVGSVSTFNQSSWSVNSRPVILFNSKTFLAFGTVFPATFPAAGVFTADQPSKSSGNYSSEILAYTPGTGYRDRKIILEPNWPSTDISPIAIRFGAVTHILDAAQTKLNTQRLTLVQRISIT